MARRRYRRKKISLKELFVIFLTLGLIGLGYNAWMWYEENKELVWSTVISFIVLAVIVFVIYKVYKNKKEKRILDSMPNQVGTIKELWMRSQQIYPVSQNTQKLHIKLTSEGT